MRSPCPYPTPADRDSPLVSPDARRQGGLGRRGLGGDGDGAGASPLDWSPRRETVASATESASQAVRFRPQEATGSVAFALCPVFCAGVRYAVALRAAVPVAAQGCGVVGEFAAEGVEDCVCEVLDGL